MRRLARFRRRFAWVLLLAPLLLVVIADARIRGGRLIGLSPKYVASYAVAMVESALLWGLLLYAASSRRGLYRWVAALLFVAFATVAVGGQLYFHRQYSTYLNLDATLFGTSLSASLFGQLKADGANFVASIAPPLLLAIALVWLGRMVVRPAQSRRSLAAKAATPIAIAGVFLIPCSYRTVQASTPDVIYFHAIGGLVKQLVGVRTYAQVRPGLRSPPALPRLTPAPVPQRNIVFVLTESVRADVACSEPVASCPATPQMNAAAPARMPLKQMRSNASTTAIELAVLWSGLQPTASREALHTAPLVFDYAKAAGIVSAYWTSHHMMFANSRLYVQDLPTAHQCGATDLDPLADIDLGARDELVTERVKRDLPAMKEPFLGVVHYGNTHVPYLVDKDDAPFQPSKESKGEGDNEAYRNFYKNAVHRQDKTVGELIRWIRKSPAGARTIIVFTSDHGEAFREHGQLCHTGSILDEEIHVPFWIDAPDGTLTDAERAQIKALRDEFTFHTDVTPTLLDLMGILDHPAIASHRERMVGSSLLRPYKPATLALSNCSGIWGCAFRNWGVMRGSLKLEAREWDSKWHCYDVRTDPLERNDLGAEACGDLVRVAEQTYGGLPSVVAK
jgi:glucan phosphoethanolaminetransferase (alkaline phosphatase superfamily)